MMDFTFIFFFILDVMVLKLFPIPINISPANFLFPSVAEIPIIFIFGIKNLRYEIASSTWTPLFVPKSSCHSSTTMDLKFLKTSLCFFELRRICKVSGVVINPKGKNLFCFILLLCGVSPVLKSTFISVFKSEHNRCVDFWISTAKALRGVIHITFIPSSILFNLKDSFKIPPQTAYVFPVPVGA